MLLPISLRPDCGASAIVQDALHSGIAGKAGDYNVPHVVVFEPIVQDPGHIRHYEK
jgi:hypothetical protein